MITNKEIETKVGTDVLKKTVLQTYGYELLNCIGTGTYAIVKLAKSARHAVPIAIKIVSKAKAPPEYIRKFLSREVDCVKGLQHENIIRFIQAIETTHRVYIVMEYAENGSLLDYIKEHKYLDEAQCKKCFKQLISAIGYCHDKGVAHRDIKCENLLMDHDLTIKLSDFGFARSGLLSKTSGEPVLSQTFCGSYAYAAPEILMRTAYLPKIADIWSSGVVLFAMTFGRLPFDDSNYSKLLQQVQNNVAFPREPYVNPLCKDIINHILAPVDKRLLIPAINKDPWIADSGIKEETKLDPV